MRKKKRETMDGVPGRDVAIHVTGQALDRMDWVDECSPRCRSPEAPRSWYFRKSDGPTTVRQSRLHPFGVPFEGEPLRFDV